MPSLETQVARVDGDGIDKEGILGQYYLLGSLEPKVRLAAAQNIVDYVSKNPTETEYALKRLLRGVYSHNKGARQGFSVALTGLLKSSPVPLNSLMALNEKMNGQKLDEKSILFGSLFCYAAYIEAGLFGDGLDTLLSQIIELGAKKSYLAILSTQILIRFLVMSEGKLPLMNELILSSVLKEGIKTPEALWLALSFTTCSSQTLDNLQEQGWKSPLMHRKNGTLLMDLLKETTQAAELHPVWTTFVSLLRQKTKKSLSLESFWLLLDTFFSSSAERKLIGFQVFGLVLPTLEADELSFIFTPSFLRCLINHLSKKDASLHVYALKVAESIAALTAQKPQLALPIMMQLIGLNGSFRFDQLTKTKTVENISKNLDADQLKGYITQLIDSFYNVPSNVSQDAGSTESYRKWVLDQLSVLVKHSSFLPNDEQGITTILTFVISHSFFQVCKSSGSIHPLAKVSDSLVGFMTDKLFMILGTLSSAAPVENGKTRNDRMGLMSNGSSWSHLALTLFTSALENPNYKLVMDLSPEIQEVLKSCLDSIQTIQKKMKKLDNASLLTEHATFLNLFSNVYFGVVSALVEPDVVNDLVESLDRFYPKSKPSKTNKRKADDEDEIPEPMAVLVDVLISFMSKNSAWLRSLACSTFKAFISKVDKSCIAPLFDVLDAKSGMDGAAELFEEIDDEEEHEVVAPTLNPFDALNRASGEMDIDQVAEADSESSSESEEENEESESDSESDFEDANPFEPVDPEFKKRLQDALGTAVCQTDDESDDEPLGDEDMQAFDDKLVEIFKQRKELKSVKKETKQQVLHFKLRVLDLMEILYKAHPQPKVVIDTIEPMLNQIYKTRNSADEKVLHDRLIALVSSRLVKSKEIIEGVKVDDLMVLLQKTHDMAQKWTLDNKLASVLSQVSLYLVRLIMHVPNSVAPTLKKAKIETVLTPTEQILQVYQNSLGHFVDEKKTKLKGSLFTDLAKRYPGMALPLLPFLLNKFDNVANVKSFAFVQAITIILTILQSTNNLVGKDAQKAQITDTVPLMAKVFANVLQHLASDKLPTNGPLSFPKDRVKELLKSILVIAKRCNKLAEVANIWKDAKLGSAYETLLQMPSYSVPSFKTILKEAQGLF